MNEFERIEEYLQGTLSHEERLRFEADMATSEELSSTFNIYKTIEVEMGGNEKYIEDEASLKRTLEGLNTRYFRKDDSDEISTGETLAQPIIASRQSPVINIQATKTFPNKNKEKTISMMKWLAAATIIGFVCLSVVFYFKNTDKQTMLATTNKPADNTNNNIIDTLPDKKEPAPTKVVKENKATALPDKKITKMKQAALFAKNFKTDGAPADKDGPLEDALKLYENKQYKEAIVSIKSADLDQVTRGDESGQELTKFYAHYYKALSLMADKNIAEAMPELQAAMENSPTQLLGKKAKWYMALACISKGDIDKAKFLLRQIAESTGVSTYRKQAEALLKDLQQ